MYTKVIPATGEIELEQKVNSFIIGKNVVDIKFTEWISYQNQTGGYTAYILYEAGTPTRQIQVKIFGVTGDADLERQVNLFIANKQVVDIKYTEWVEFEAETGGYSALVMYLVDQNSQSQIQQPGQNNRLRSKSRSGPQFNVL